MFDPKKVRAVLGCVVVASTLGRGAGAAEPLPTPSLPAPSSPVTLPPPQQPAGAQPLRDPLLADTPPAARTLRTWEDGARLLRARSTDLAIAVADVQQAEAQSRGALAALVGVIRFDGSYAANILLKSSAQISGITSAGQPTFETLSLPQRHFGIATATGTLPLIAPRSWVALQTAHMNEDVQRAQLANTQRTLRQAFAETVIAVVSAERSAEMSRAALAAALDRLDLVVRKKTLGGGTLLDVVRSQQDLEAARAQVVAANESVRQARESLGLAVGLKEEVAVATDFRLDDAITEMRGSCRLLPSLASRADIVAAALQRDVAHQGVKDAHAEYLPTLSVETALSTTNEDLGAYPQTQWYVEGLISWNLWDGGTRYADERNAEAMTTVAAAKLEQAERNEAIEVTRAKRAVVVAEDARDVAKRETGFATEQDRLTRLAYQTGQGTSLELVTAASALRTQAINLVLREYDVVSAQLDALFVQASCHL